MLHGEYKVPGGKLVAVDLAVEGGRFAHVSISGDFFLEPDSALDAMNAAVVGMSALANVDELARAISVAVGSAAALVGFSPQAVGAVAGPCCGSGTGTVRWS